MRSGQMAVGLGLVGLAVSGALVWGLSVSSTTINGNWLPAVDMLPLVGIFAGWKLAGGKREDLTGGGTAAYAALGGLLSGLAGYLTFVIASHNWNLGALPPDQAGLLYQMLHPSVLPELASNSKGHSSTMGWCGHLVVGAFVGVLMTPYTMKKQWT